MALPDSLNAQTVLRNLVNVVALAQQNTDLIVTAVKVDLAAVTSKTGGAGTPQVALLPSDLVSGELTRADSQRIVFNLKLRDPARSLDDLDDNVRDAIDIINAGLLALRPLQDRFETSAAMEFKFELTGEGKFNFVLRVGAKSVDTHVLTLEVKPAP